MGTQLVEIRASDEQLAQLEEVATECRNQLANQTEPFRASFAVAAAMRKLNELITDEMMEDVMALQGHPLGFKTDKDRDKHGGPGPGYDVSVVRPVFIEATARGFRMTNNEVNIIAGRFYGAKSGFERLVKTFPGLSDFQDAIGIPERAGGRAFVSYVASWNINGVVRHFQRSKKRLADGTDFDDRFVIRVNEGMVDDAIIGKTLRKAYAAIYDVLTGSAVPTPDGSVDDAIDVDSRPVGSPKVQQSNLFADPPEEPRQADNQDGLLAEYRDKLTAANTKTHVGPIAKQAGADQRLTDASRKTVMDWCSTRRGEL